MRGAGKGVCGRGGSSFDLANCASDHVGKGHAGAGGGVYQYLANARPCERSVIVIICECQN